MSDQRLLRVLAAVALLLSTVGCVLSSKAPLFTAADGATPIAVATNYDAYSKDGEGWKKEDDVFRFEAAGPFSKREYTVQYNETDLNFVERLLEEEGIFYFFDAGIFR